MWKSYKKETQIEWNNEVLFISYHQYDSLLVEIWLTTTVMIYNKVPIPTLLLISLWLVEKYIMFV